MTPKIKFQQDVIEFSTVERCLIKELSNDPDDADVSIAQARVLPGVTTAWHRLTGTSERYVILSGQGVVEVGDLVPERVGAGDVVIIPAETRQRITNLQQEDLVFLAICSPRFDISNYMALE